MALRTWAGDRFGLFTLALLLLVTIAAWAGTIIEATSMAMAGPVDLMTYVVAWVVMMAAMMLPSAAPMILLYRTVAHRQYAQGHPFIPTWIFVLGYLVVWAAFGVVVYLVSQLVDTALGSDARLAVWAPYGVALVLLAAGAYQFTPLKRVCLRGCQSPLGFLMGHWKPGSTGALRMGLEHGAYCAGCCWGLMAVLVAAGAMGLVWVLLIALVVAMEKLLPMGEWAVRITGMVLLGLGALVAVRPELVVALRGDSM